MPSTRLTETFRECLGFYVDSTIMIDFEAKDVYVDGRRTPDLCPARFLVLTFLISKPGRCRTGEELNRVIGSRGKKAGWWVVKRLRKDLGWTGPNSPLRQSNHGWTYQPRTKEVNERSTV